MSHVSCRMFVALSFVFHVHALMFYLACLCLHLSSSVLVVRFPCLRLHPSFLMSHVCGFRLHLACLRLDVSWFDRSDKSYCSFSATLDFASPSHNVRLHQGLWSLEVSLSHTRLFSVSLSLLFFSLAVSLLSFYAKRASKMT